MLLAPAQSPGAAEFGSNLLTTPSGSSGCGAPSCTMWNTALYPGNTQGTVASPIDGVLVAFTIRKAAASAWTPLHVRVIEHVGASTWRGHGSSSPDVTPLVAAGSQTFQARVPIGAGDYLGFEQTGLATTGTLFAAAPGIFGAAIAVSNPSLPSDGSPAAAASNGYELLLKGRVEPDADGDGFGDETQDRCPGASGTEAGCVPKKKCKRKQGKKKGKAAGAAKKKKCKKRKKKKDGV